MPELLLEFFSEEIPARMQRRAAADLERLLGAALAPLSPTDLRTWHGPRRIALAATLAAEVPAERREERGPRLGAPDQALEGFLRKHGASREALVEQSGHHVLVLERAASPAASLIAEAVPALARRFPWPKSMRWGESGFLWVRPLRRILCLLDGAVVPFALADGADAAHELASGDLTEGHRFLAPGAFAVGSVAEWEAALRARFCEPDATARAKAIADGVGALAAAKQLSVVPDAALLDEVAGLVEWPVPLLGRIDDAFMDLPAEVMQVSMRVNQRYFSTRDADGRAAPWFGFAANVVADDGGAAIIAGNERVLRARFSDARHFWDQDRRTPLGERVAALDGVVFHEKLGTQGARAERISHLARFVAERIGVDPERAARAGLLAKADLVSGMVGEFPELQGVMGGYYARHDGEGDDVADAIGRQYYPAPFSERLPSELGAAVLLADRFDTLAGFFAIGERPTGSGDPFALRRAALAAILVISSHDVVLPLRPVLARAAAPFGGDDALVEALLAFIVERLRVRERSDGRRHDVLDAVFAAGAGDDLGDMLYATGKVSAYIGSEGGRSLLAGYRRAANILRIEDRKDGPHAGIADAELFRQPEEAALHERLAEFGGLDARDRSSRVKVDLALPMLSALRPAVDAFFERVTVNDSDPGLRSNRLRLLASVRDAMGRVADFSRIQE